MVDCELLTSQYSGRKTQEEIQEILHAFPAWFSRRLLEVRALDPGCRLECVMKDKTREVGPDVKNSAHFVFNLAGIPRQSHREVCQRVCEPWRDSLSTLFRTKNLDHVPDDDLDNPVFFLDIRAMHGSQGFATLGGRKKPGDPLPFLSFKFAVDVAAKGEMRVTKKELGSRRHEELSMLYISSYTVGRAGTIAYARSFQVKPKVNLLVLPASGSRTLIHTGCGQEKKGVGRTGPRTTPVPRPAGDQVLPAWLKSELRDRGGYFANTTMRSLYSSTCGPGGYYWSLVSNLPEDPARDLQLAHVTNMPCPVRMCADPPTFKTHTNNGVIVAVDGETVYATCTYCGLYDRRDRQSKTKPRQPKNQGGLHVVPGTESNKYRWYIMTEGVYKSMRQEIEGQVLPG